MTGPKKATPVERWKCRIVFHNILAGQRQRFVGFRAQHPVQRRIVVEGAHQLDRQAGVLQLPVRESLANLGR